MFASRECFYLATVLAGLKIGQMAPVVTSRNGSSQAMSVSLRQLWQRQHDAGTQPSLFRKLVRLMAVETNSGSGAKVRL